MDGGRKCCCLCTLIDRQSEKNFFCFVFLSVPFTLLSPDRPPSIPMADEDIKAGIEAAAQESQALISQYEDRENNEGDSGGFG